MDRQTLQQYGWIIILTLVIAVMLAFSQPFGRYVGTGIGNVAGSLAYASKNSVSKDNIDELKEDWKETLDWEAVYDMCTVGDLNDDGKFNNRDLCMLQRVVYGLEATDLAIAASDTNWDGTVNSNDLTLFQNYLNYNSGDFTHIDTRKPIENKKIVVVGSDRGSVLVGNVNGDTKINNHDLARLEQALRGWDIKVDLFAADTNRDGVLTEQDIYTLQCGIAGWSGEPYENVGKTMPILYDKITITRMSCTVGDINADGKINNKDLVMMEQFNAGWDVTDKTVTEGYVAGACDIDNDGIITKDDTLILQNYLTHCTEVNNEYYYIGKHMYYDVKTFDYT